MNRTMSRRVDGPRGGQLYQAASPGTNSRSVSLESGIRKGGRGGGSGGWARDGKTRKIRWEEEEECVCVCVYGVQNGRGGQRERENSGKVSSLRNDTSGLYSGNAGWERRSLLTTGLCPSPSVLCSAVYWQKCRSASPPLVVSSRHSPILPPRRGFWHRCR